MGGGVAMVVELLQVGAGVGEAGVPGLDVCVIASLVKAATPVPLVVAVSVPPNVPPPVAIAAVTTTPLWLTALPLASRTWITGCWANEIGRASCRERV